MLPTIQQHVVHVSRESALEFFKYAAAVPEDKLDWQPEGVGQCARKMAKEIAVTPLWALSAMGCLEGEHNWAEMMDAWKTVEDCRAAFHENFKRWEECVLAFSDDKLLETKWLPFNGGRDHTYLELLEYPRWNSTYHVGQVAYIQTLYGDKQIY